MKKLKLTNTIIKLLIFLILPGNLIGQYNTTIFNTDVNEATWWSITDSNNGFIRQTIEQEYNHGYSVIDTRTLGTGTYICHISSNGMLVGVAKFIILQ